jgi:mRNA interferase RelE/StbE
MFRVKLTAKAKEELKQISKSHKIAIGLILEDIKEDPTIGKSLTRELTGRYSYRVGVYRIIYKVNRKDEIINVLTAGHRATVYK